MRRTTEPQPDCCVASCRRQADVSLRWRSMVAGQVCECPGLGTCLPKQDPTKVDMWNHQQQMSGMQPVACCCVRMHQYMPLAVHGPPPVSAALALAVKAD